MAGMRNSEKNAPDCAALADLLENWLPTVWSDQGSLLATFCRLADIGTGEEETNVAKRGFRWADGPTVRPRPMLSDGPTALEHGYVLKDKPNSIYLNGLLVGALNDVGDDEEARNFVRGKILHELIHWAELKHPAQDRHLFDRPVDHGRLMELAFHGLPEDVPWPPMPAALAGAFKERVAAGGPPGALLVDGQVDGRESLGSRLTAEANADLLEALATERLREEPVLSMQPAGEFADPAADRLASPDFLHLGLAYDGRPFKLGHRELELLCRLNDADPQSPERTLIGLRGCRLATEAADAQLLQAEVAVAEARYDHEARRCLLGVWDRGSGRIALFPGSTVPNRRYVAKQAQSCAGGAPSARVANLLPTGLYGYVCGLHNDKVWGAFRLESEVVVLRSCGDAGYTTDDFWDICHPYDNIHPTYEYYGGGFSSAGCQTVAGTFVNDKHKGDWAAFRQCAGLGNTKGDHGRRFDYLLTTAREMRLVRYLLDRLGREPTDGDLADLASVFGRLRFGSQGPRVRALQEALGTTADGDFGPATMAGLIGAQKRQGLPGDGICSPRTALSLGLSLWQPGPGQGLEPAAIRRPEPVPVPQLNLSLPVHRGDKDSPSVRRIQQALNRLGHMRVVDGDYGRRTAESVTWARQNYGLAGDGNRVDTELASALLAEPPLHAALSTEGATFVGLTEIGSPAYYDKEVTYPHYPGEKSGITIGFGYDLRYVSAAELQTLWGALLPADMLAALSPHCGKAGSKQAAKALEAAGHKVPFQAGASIFLGHSLPKAIAATRVAYAELDALPALCQAALVSLVNNRGNSLEDSDRRKEMIQIRDALRVPQRQAKVPALFEAMKRLWPNSEGVRKRRDAEAELFRRGLAGDPGY